MRLAVSLLGHMTPPMPVAQHHPQVLIMHGQQIRYGVKGVLQQEVQAAVARQMLPSRVPPVCVQ